VERKWNTSQRKLENMFTGDGYRELHAVSGFNRRRTFHLSFALVALVLGAGAQAKVETKPPEEPSVNPRLAQVKRICVQRFGEDAIGSQAQETIIAKLFESKRFTLTEKCDTADFLLKGFVTERTEVSSRSESEGVSFGKHASTSTREGSGSGSVQGSGHESLSSSETKQQAVITMRLVDKEGEILWAVSMESKGGLAKGAVGDAADHAVLRFLRDIDRAEKQASENKPPPK
jgi:hypothetical protein